MRYKRILVIKLGALGDVVQAEGAYRDIRAFHPEATIIAMTSPPYRRFFERCPWVDEVVVDRREPRWNLYKMADLRRRLRELGVDMVYDLQQVKRTHFYFRWFLSDVDWMGKAEGCRYQFPPVPGRCALDQFDDQLAALEIPHEHVLHADLGWMAEEMDEYLAEAGLSDPFVVLIPGASAGQDRKRWPLYDELAGWLKGRGVTPVTVPGPEEIGLCESFENALMLVDDNGSYLDFFKLAGLVKRAAFIVGNDTGPTHIAASLKRTGLVLFGGNHPATMTGLQHSELDLLEVDNLQELPLTTVQQRLDKLFFSAHPG